MRAPTVLLALSLALGVGCGAGKDVHPELEWGDAPAKSAIPRDPSDPPLVPRKFALVELFTSEGCPSCPPADAVLADLATREGEGILGLSFHVDYWDVQGHKDPFGDGAYTQRQYAYARVFRERGLYTPQAVVSGAKHVNGSDRFAVARAVDAALEAAHPTAVDLVLTEVLGQPAFPGQPVSHVRLRYRVDGAPGGSSLHIAVFERTKENRVGAGENNGRLLRHANVVRRFLTVPVSGAARDRLDVTLAQPILTKNLGLVAFVQASDMRVLAAAPARLASKVAQQTP